MENPTSTLEDLFLRIVRESEERPGRRAQDRDAATADELDAADLSLNASLAESSGNDHAVDVAVAEMRGCAGRIEIRRVHPLHVAFGGQVRAGVLDRLVDRGVGVAQGRVLPQDADGDRVPEV